MIRKVELETRENEFGTVYEIHIYLKFRIHPVTLSLPTWEDNDVIVLHILDFLKRMIQKGA